MPEFLKNIFDKAKEYFFRLNRTQRIIAFSTIGAVFMLMIILSASGSSKYASLFTNLASKDAKPIMQQLQKMSVRSKYEGRTIYVDKNQVNKVRLELASQNLLPGKGIVGLEIFDKSRLSMTDFERQMNYLRALQGELSRMIIALSPVENATVLIALPKKELYIEDQKPPTAAIRLELKSGAQLSKKLVKGIINLVSRSVAGLLPGNITVVDNRGNTLSQNLEKPVSSQKQLELRSESELNLQRHESKILENRINTKLKNVLGRGRVETIVKVELKFNTLKGTRKIYTPVYKQLGQFRKPFLQPGLARSTKNTKEYYSGAGAVPGGVPGVESNIPGYKALLNSETTTYGKSEDIVNYELNEVDEQYQSAPVEIKRITVAVFVDWVNEPVRLPDGTFKVNRRGAIEFHYRPRTDEELKRLISLVKAAIGYSLSRGDDVSVQSIQFTRAADIVKLEAEQKRLRKIELLKRVMWPVITLIFIFIFLILFFQQFMVYRQVKIEEFAVDGKLRTFKELELRQQRELEEELKREESAKDQLLRGLIAYTKRNPRIAADIVRTWLFES